MNIGIVTTWFERGAALVSRAYVDTLSREHSVFVYARGGERYAKEDPRWDLPNVSWGQRVDPIYGTNIHWPDFESWVYRHHLDVILFNEQKYWKPILKCLDLDVLIGTYVDFYTEETLPFFALYDFLFCNTRRHYSVFEDHPQAFYIPWGTDCAAFRPDDRRPDCGEVVFFHSAGRGGVNLRKGTDILVKAFRKIAGPARLVIHSQVALDQYGDAASIVRDSSRIDFINTTVSAPGLYHLGDVYVYPTKLEGIGLTVPEALACGLPVITTDEAPMNEFVIDGFNGMLIPIVERRRREDDYYWPESICSEVALTAAMQRYLDAPTLAEEHGQRARAYALEHLSWSKNSQDLPHIVKTLQPARSNASSLQRQVRSYERRRMRPNHIHLAFLAHRTGKYAAAREHLVRAIVYEPRHLRNPGVWSVAGDCFLGARHTATLRRLLRTISGSR